MKKKKMVNKTFSNKLEIIPEKNEKDITQPIDSFSDFVIIEKKDKIKETSLKQNENIESENNILKDFVVLQRRPKQAQEQSRFFQFFKECIEFIENATKIYIHCMAGVSRSPTIVIAYLMWTQKMKFIMMKF